MTQLDLIPEQPGNSSASEIAKAFSALGASKGGKARAKALSPERRREIGRAAIEARWAKQGKPGVPRPTHTGDMRIGDFAMECSVLEDGQRVLSQRGFMGAIGFKHGGTPDRSLDAGGVLPFFVAHKALRPFIDNDLMLVLVNPVKYQNPRGGGVAHGIKAEIIPRICDIWLRARDAGVLGRSQLAIAAKADVLMRGLAHVGIVALVDEATGFQDDRERNALAKILEAFVAKELRPWVHTFPADYYRQMFRLKGKEYAPNGNRMPRYFGVLTNNVVYSRLAPGVLEELRRVTPRNEKGRLKHHLHRKLTDNVGHPKLLQHLGAVVALMKITPDKQWDSFIQLLDKTYPQQTELPLLEYAEQQKLDREAKERMQTASV